MLDFAHSLVPSYLSNLPGYIQTLVMGFVALHLIVILFLVYSHFSATKLSKTNDPHLKRNSREMCCIWVELPTYFWFLQRFIQNHKAYLSVIRDMVARIIFLWISTGFEKMPNFKSLIIWGLSSLLKNVNYVIYQLSMVVVILWLWWSRISKMCGLSSKSCF